MSLTNETIIKLDRIAVRTSLINPAEMPKDDGVNEGSGILLGTRNKWYVLTAKHCVRDKKKEEILVQVRNLDGTFRRISVKDVTRDESAEWALLEVEHPKNQIHFSEVKLGCDDIIVKVHDRDAFVFRGYPEKYRKGQTLDLKCSGTNEWTVKGQFDLTECSFAEYIEGFSGSGIVTESEHNIYCVGIVEEVKGTTGLYGTVISTPSSFYAEALVAKGEGSFQEVLDKSTQKRVFLDPAEYMTRYCSTVESQTSLDFAVTEKEGNTLLDYVSGRVEGIYNYHYILLGDPQSGKTFEMKHLAKQLQDQGYDVRILAFKDIAALSVLENDSRIAILIDAIDEAPDGSFQDIITAIEQCAGSHYENIIVVSTREGYVKSEQLDGFCRLYLQDLQGQQIDARIREKSSEAESLFLQIRENGLSDQVTKPFFLNYVIDAFNHGLELPSDNALLYQGWVKASCAHVNEKHPEIAESADDAYKPILQMALALQLTANVQIGEAELRKVVGEEGLIILQLNELVTEDNDTFAFVHNSVREYLVARYLLDMPIEDVRRRVCYSNSEMINPIWTNVAVLWLQLLSARDGEINHELISWLLRNNAARSLLVSCNKRYVAEDVRFEVFRSVIEDTSNKERYFSWFDNSFLTRLVHFAEGDKMYSYVYKRLLSYNRPCPHYYNIMLIISIMDWHLMERTNDDLYTKLKSLLLDNLIIFKSQNPDCGVLYFLLNDAFYNDDGVVGKVFDVYKDDDRKETVSSLLSLVVRADIADRYLEYIIGKCDMLASKESNIYMVRSIQYKALSSVNELSSLLAALHCVCEKKITDHIYNQNEYLEMVETILNKIAHYDENGDKGEIAAEVEACFWQRFSETNIFVDTRVRKELDAYKSLLASFELWSEDSDSLYLELYNRGLLTSEQEAEIRERKQRDFEDFCDYKTFKKQVLDVVDRYEQSGSTDWIGFGIGTDGHYNVLLNRYLVDHSGMRTMNCAYVRQSISNESAYNCYRMTIVEEHLYGRSDRFEISDAIMTAVTFTALALLKDKLSGKSVGDRNLKSAIHYLIDGKVTLPDNELIQLLEYSHECISGEFDIDNYCDSTPLLSTMRNQMGDEKLAGLICERLQAYKGGNHLFFIQWVRYLLGIQYQSAKDILLDMMSKTENETLKESILTMLIEFNTGIEEICRMMPEMNNEDLLHCCNSLDGREDCGQIIKQLLESRMDEFEGYYQKMCLRQLFKLGSMKALAYGASNADFIGQDADSYDFDYSTPDALSYLSALLPVVQQSDYVKRATTSILNSMGAIAEQSDEDYKLVCEELDDCMRQDSRLAFLENTKHNFYNRLLQRKERKMTIDEAIQNINELCQKYPS